MYTDYKNMAAPAVQKQAIDIQPLRNSKAPIIFIVGGPGSGKGTQCEKLVAKYHLSHLSSGDLLRDEVASKSARGAQLQKMMEAGQLVPLEVVLDLLKEAMVSEVKNGSKGFLIDGYPREIDQGLQFESQILPCSLVIYFEVPEDVMVQRLLHRGKTSGRADDNEATIKLRLKTFTNQTQPVVLHYEKQNKLARINAEAGVDDVFKKVVPVMDKLMAA